MVPRLLAPRNFVKLREHCTYSKRTLYGWVDSEFPPDFAEDIGNNLIDILCEEASRIVGGTIDDLYEFEAMPTVTTFDLSNCWNRAIARIMESYDKWA